MNMNLEGIPEHQHINDHLPTSSTTSVSNKNSTNRPAMREDAIAARLADMLKAGVKLSRIAIESNVSKDKLEAWIEGDRPGEVTKDLSNWFIEIDEEIDERNGDFFITPTAEIILRAFEHAREPRGRDRQRGIAMIYGAAGTGKSATAKWVTRMDCDNVFYVQVDGERRTWVGLLSGIAESIGYGGHPAVGEKLGEFITRKIPRGGLMIFDHAQLLQNRIMEQLLIFPDQFEIALAFIGNVQGYRKFVNAKIAQINSRVRGAIVFVEMPSEEDIDAMLGARGISGRKEREFCLMIGRQDGGLRYLDAAILEAQKIAYVSGVQKVDLKLLKLGAANAGCWGATSES